MLCIRKNLEKKINKLKQKPWRRGLIVLVLVCFLMFLSLSIWQNKSIIVSFNVQTTKDLTIKVFYTSHSKNSFDEKESLKQLVKAGNNDVVFKLPSKNIIKFRIDFDSNPGEVKLSNIVVSGNKLFRLDGEDLWSFNQHIEKHSFQNGVLSLVSNQLYPSIIYKKELNVLADHDIDWCLFIICLAFAIFLSSTIVFYLAKFKIFEFHSRIEIVFLTVFFVLLCIPMSHISDAEMSEQENRILTKAPSLYVAGQINKIYGKDFEKWFNDRFWGRDFFIGLYSKVILSFNNKMNNKKVFQGKDGWLFYKEGGSIENFQNAILFRDEELKNIATQLRNIYEWCEKRNKKFYFIIAPDKNKIYGEYFPEMKKKRPDSQSRARQLVQYLEKYTDVKTLFLYDVLLNNKDKGLLYYRNDTHWNELGAYWGYQEIMNMVGRDFPDVSVFQANGYKEIKHLRGDLTWMYPVKLQFDDDTSYEIPQVDDMTHCDGDIRDSLKSIMCTSSSSSSSLSVLAFRDSFTINLAPYFGKSFGKIQYIWRYDINNEDAELMQNADIVFLIIVERNIGSLGNLKFTMEN